MSRYWFNGFTGQRRRWHRIPITSAFLATMLALAGPATVGEAAIAGSVWEQIGADIDGDARDNNAGLSVALSGDGTRMIVGIPAARPETTVGRARVFELDRGAWHQVGNDIEGDPSAREAGSSVAISGNGHRIVVGSIRAGNGSGHARVFEWSGSAWTQLGSPIAGANGIGFSGFSSAMSSDGSRVIIGAPVWPVTAIEAGGFSGYSWVQEWTGSNWQLMGSPVAGDAGADLSGFSVDISGDGSRMIVGELGSDASGADAGRVRVFDWSGVSWVQSGADITGLVVGGQSGYDVAVSSDGQRVVVGTPSNPSGGTSAGHARVFELDAGAWASVGSIIEGTTTDERAGHSVDIDADGSRVIVGSPGHSSILGRARVFDLSGGDWSQVGADLVGESHYDAFGFAVAISDNGERIVVGTPFNDGVDVDSGHVRAFDFTLGVP